MRTKADYKKIYDEEGYKYLLPEDMEWLDKQDDKGNFINVKDNFKEVKHMAADKWDGWNKVEMAGVWDFKAEPVIQGVLVSREEKVGPNESMMYTLQRTDGTNIGVWGTTVIDGRMKNVQIGEEVGIEYLGEAVSPQTKRKYNNFEVYHRAVPMTKVVDPNEDKIPFD